MLGCAIWRAPLFLISKSFSMSELSDSINAFGANVIGAANAVMSGKTDKQTRKLNYKMFTEGNQFNAQQNQLARDYNTQMWNANNEYNTPANQMSRFEAAGINPYNAFSQIQSGNGQQTSAPGAASSVAAPSMPFHNPIEQYISGVSSSLDNALKVISVDRESKLTPSIVDKSIQEARGAAGVANKNLAEGIKEQNDLVNEPSRVAANANLYQSQFHEFAFNSQKYALLGQGVPEIVANELAQMRSNTQIMQLQAEGMGYDNQQKYAIAKYAEASEKARLDQLVAQGDLTKEQAENMRKQNSFFEKITYAQLANYAAQTAAAYGSADASHAVAGLSRQQTATERERTSYERQQNDWFTPSYDQRMYRSGKYGENSESYAFYRSMYRAGEFLKSFVPSLFGTPKH
jgi:hypothetical protein